MVEHFWLGMVVIFIGGALNGSFALPMKYCREWRWENTWLAFAFVSLLLLPTLMAVGFVPHLRDVYAAVPNRTLLYPLLFGFLWGIAQTTFGLGIQAVGMALAFAVVSGLACLSGSLVPLLVLSPDDLLRPRGILLLISMPILFVGLALYGRAGRRREREQGAAGAAAGTFMTGLAICIFTGIFGSSFNLGFAFSGDLPHQALERGATPLTATYAVWALVLGAGFFPNLFYCLYLLLRHRTLPRFWTRGSTREAFLSSAMGVLWLSGILIYGIGTTLVGRYGTSMGYALFVTATILSANLLGLVTGEWKGTSRPTRKLLAIGLAVILIAVVVLNLGGMF
jgi:L-rhamnose-H+ transport protein